MEWTHRLLNTFLLSIMPSHQSVLRTLCCFFFSLFWEAKCSISLYFNSNLMKTLKFSTRLQHFGECLWWRSRPTFLILYTIREGMLPRDCMPTCSSIVYVLFLFLKSSFQHGCLFKHILENYGFRVYKHSRWLSLME